MVDEINTDGLFYQILGRQPLPSDIGLMPQHVDGKKKLIQLQTALLLSPEGLKRNTDVQTTLGDLGDAGYHVVKPVVGYHNHAFSVLRKDDRQYILKFSLEEQFHRGLQGEVEWNQETLALLRDHHNGSFTVPEVVKSERQNKSTYLVEEFVEGVDLAKIEPRVELSQTEYYLPRIAKVATFLDAVELPSKKIKVPSSELAKSMSREVRAWGKQSMNDRKIDQSTLTRITEEFDQSVETLEHGWQHGDFVPWNFRVTPDGSLVLMDSELGGAYDYPKGYDAASFYNRLWTRFGRRDLARSFLKLYQQETGLTREQVLRRIKPSLIHRAIGGVYDDVGDPKYREDNYHDLIDIISSGKWDDLFQVPAKELDFSSKDRLLARGETFQFTGGGRWALEGKSNQDISTAIRENFMHGDRIYVGLPDKIGDAVQITAFLRSIDAARKLLSVRTPVTLLIPSYQLREILTPLAKRYGFEIVPSGRLQTVFHADSMSAERGEKNCLILEMDTFEGKTWAGKHTHNGAVWVRDLFGSFNSRYSNKSAGIARYAQFTEDLLSFKRGVLKDSDCLPVVALPDHANNIYQTLIEKYHIDTKKRQILLAIEASTPGRMYDRWSEVVGRLKEHYADTIEINIIFNPNTPPDDPTRVDPNIWHELSKKYSGVRAMSMSLEEAAVLLANQSLVIAVDSGISHIAGAVEGGPNVVSLYIPPQTDPDIWVSNPSRMVGISAPIIDRDPHSPIGGDMCRDPQKKWINAITPEEITAAAGTKIRSSAEAPSFSGQRVDALRTVFSEVLGRPPKSDEILTFMASDRSIRQIADELRESPEQPQAIVSTLYERILGRSVDSDGLLKYSREIRQGTPEAQIVHILVDSDEYQARLRKEEKKGRKSAVEFLYRSLFGRTIDADGSARYSHPDMPIREVITEIFASDEFSRLYSTKTKVMY